MKIGTAWKDLHKYHKQTSLDKYNTTGSQILQEYINHILVLLCQTCMSDADTSPDLIVRSLHQWYVARCRTTRTSLEYSQENCDDLIQDYGKSSALAKEIPWCCAKLYIYAWSAVLDFISHSGIFPDTIATILELLSVSNATEICLWCENLHII